MSPRKNNTARVIDDEEEYSDDGDEVVSCQFKRCVVKAPRDELKWCGDCSSLVCSDHFVTHADCCEACHKDQGGDSSLDDVEGSYKLDNDETNTYELIDGFTFDRFE